MQLQFDFIFVRRHLWYFSSLGTTVSVKGCGFFAAIRPSISTCLCVCSFRFACLVINAIYVACLVGLQWASSAFSICKPALRRVVFFFFPSLLWHLGRSAVFYLIVSERPPAFRLSSTAFCFTDGCKPIALDRFSTM